MKRGEAAMKSDIVKSGIERTPHRSLLKALGCTDKEIRQPFIGIVNSFSEVVPGHIHLRSIAEAVKSGVRQAGGTPFEVNTIAVCDGIAMNHFGMRFSLPSREIIADSVEIVAQAHAFDALLFVTNCDKIIPGMIMAAARLNVPSIFVSGGPMLAGRMGAQSVDLNSVFMAVGKVARRKMGQAELRELEEIACPGCGSCAGMFTATTMNCLTGARGAVGGSTNSVLHLMAIAHEAGVEFPLSMVNDISDRTPYLCKLSPTGDYHIEDFDLAGGVPALMAELSKAKLLRPRVVRVSGRSLRDETAPPT